MRARAAAILTACVWVAACSTARVEVPATAGGTGSASSATASTPILSVPFHAQDAHQCGPASLAMALEWSGVPTTPDALVPGVYTPGRKGSLQADLVAAARRHDRVAFEIRGEAELAAELAAGHPVVVLQNLGLTWLPRWHYAVVIGGGANADAYVLHTGSHEARRVGRRTFLNTWTRAGAWGLVVVPPERIAASADEPRWLTALVGLEAGGRSAAAAKGYATALERWSDSLAAAIGLGNASYAAGDLTSAERALRQAVASHPESAPAWNNLAHVLAEGGRTREALDAARRAVELGGHESAVYAATLAEIEAR